LKTSAFGIGLVVAELAVAGGCKRRRPDTEAPVSAPARSPLTADDGFCWVHGVSACASGYCVVDTNCDRVAVWSRRGEHVGNARASELLGLRRPWLSAITTGRRGVFIAAASQREPQAANVSEGMLFRVAGL
jgi:hypothetical protein